MKIKGIKIIDERDISTPKPSPAGSSSVGGLKNSFETEVSPFSEGPASQEPYSTLKQLSTLDGVRIGIFRTRLSICLIMAVHFFAYVFIDGPINYFQYFK